MKADTSENLFKVRYPELELVRATAILLVMAFHFSSNYRLPEDVFITRLLKWGWHGVDLFFVLSGFLIGGQIIEDILAGRFSFRVFYIKRFWRIFPPYYFAIAVFVAIYAFAANGNIMKETLIVNDVKIHLLYLQNYFTPVIYGGVYWSLAVEEQFYLFIPLVLVLALRYLRGYLLLFFSLTVLLIASIGVMMIGIPVEDWRNYVEHTLRGLGGLMAGVTIAYLFITQRKRLLATGYALRISLIAAAIIAIALSVWTSAPEAGGLQLVNFSLTALGFAILILYMTVFSVGRYMVFKGAFTSVARLSYTMYLYHTLIALLLTTSLPGLFSVRNPGLLNFFERFALYFLAVYLVSAVVYFLIDRPCMGYRKKVLAQGR